MRSPLRISGAFLGICVLVSLSTTAPADVLVGWDTPTSTTTVTNTVASQTATGVTGGDIVKGVGLSLSSSSSGWRASLYNQTGIDLTALTNANTGNDYWSFSVSAQTGFNVVLTNIGVLSFGISASGPKNWGLIYSTNSFSTWQVVATGSQATNSTASYAATFGAALAASNITVAAGTTAYFRLVGYGASSTSGTGGIANQSSAPDFTILGTSTYVNPIYDLVWSGGSGDWAVGAVGWNDGTNSTNWSPYNNATINADGSALTVSNNTPVGNITVANTTGVVSIGGSPLAAASLTKTNAGSLVLGASNSFGNLSLLGGSTRIDAVGSLGVAALTMDGGGVEFGTGVTNLANNIALGAAGGSVKNVNEATLVGAVTGSNNVLTKSGNGLLILSGNLGAAKAGVGVTVDEGSLLVTGAGKNFARTNSWTGNVNFSNATVYLADNFESAGAGILGVAGSSISCVFGTAGGSATISNSVDFSGTNSLSSASGKNLKFEGLTLSGNGVLNISASSTNSVRLTTSGSTFSGAVVFNPSGADGTLQINSQSLASASSVTVNANTATNFLGFSANFVFRNTNDGIFPAAITGAGGIGINATNGSRVTLGTNNTYTGKTFLQAGDFVIDAPAGSIGTNDIVGNGATGRLALGSGSALNVIIPNNVVALQTFTTNTNTLVVTTNTYTAAFAAGIGKSITLDGVVSGGGVLKASGGGDLIPTKTSNSYTGGTEIGTGAIVVANPAVLSTGPVNFGTGSNSFLRFTASATLNNPVTISGLAGTGTGTNAYTANFKVDSGCEVVLASSVSNKWPVGTNSSDQKFGGRVEKWGFGTLVMAASNNFTETLKLNEGVLVLSNSGAIGATNPVTFNGGTLRLAQASGDVVAGATAVEADSVLDLGSAPAHTVRFGALSFSTTAVTLTVTNTANGSVYLPTDTTTNNLAQIKSAENPTYTAALDPATGLLSFSAGIVAPTNLSYAPPSVDGVVGAAIPNMSPTVTGTVDSYAINPALPAGLSIDPTSGVISGTPSVELPATWFTVTAANAAGSTTADVYISVVTPYQSWAAGYGLAGASALGTSDPDKDGLNNNSEYAFGTDPTVANATLLVTSVSGSNYTVTWIERDSGLVYNVQSTANLATTAFANDGSVVVGTSGNQTGVPSGYTRKQFTVTASGAKYYRVRATP